MKSVKNSVREKSSVMLILLWIGALLVNIKSIFTDFDVDAVYALVTACRNIFGDKMFSQMLEPHQTSAFLPEIFIYPFYKISGSLDWVVIYLQVIGVIIFALLTYKLYRVLSLHISYEIAALMCIFFFTVRPKQLVFPEFSNMLIIFSTLLFCFLVELYNNPERPFLIIPAAISLCLAILSYPTFIIAYPAVILLIYFMYPDKWKNIIRLTVICAICGILYLSYFIFTCGIDNLTGNLSTIISGDSSHLNSLSDVTSYFEATVRGIILIAFCGIIAWGITILTHLKKYFFTLWAALFAVSHMSIFIYCNIKEGAMNAWYFTYASLYLLIIVLGIAGIRLCSDIEKNIYCTGMVLSVCSFISVIFLTNQSLVTILPYLILAAMVSFIPFAKKFPLKPESVSHLCSGGFLAVFCIFMIFHRGITTRDYYTIEGSLLDVRNIVREGPAKGIVCSYMGYYQSRANYNDCMEYLNADDSLLLVGSHSINTIMYIYMPFEISHYSTICTPTYDETLLDYWDKYPEKMPSVIAVESWYGNLTVDENSWIMEWLNEHYTTYQDGTFWRFYR